LAIWLFIARSLLPYNPVKNSLYKILINSLMESTCHQVNLDFIRSHQEYQDFIRMYGGG